MVLEKMLRKKPLQKGPISKNHARLRRARKKRLQRPAAEKALMQLLLERNLNCSAIEAITNVMRDKELKDQERLRQIRIVLMIVKGLGPETQNQVP